jgi:methylated-DNA-[protein]-cysteine S-methyltransferase
MTGPEILHRSILDSPLGPLTAIGSPRGLCFLEFQGRDRQSRIDARLSRWFAPFEMVDASDGLLDTTATWLRAYFKGRVAAVGPTPLDLRGTAFEHGVWSCLLQVPPGATFTYGAIAERLGDPNKARAVGAAVGANPVSIIVPCHRIVGANGSLVGYGGGIERKRWLLTHETQFAAQSPGRLF